MSGQAVRLLKGSLTAATGGTFALTGQVAELKAGYRLSADVGSFAVTGQSAGFAVALTAAQGAFVLTGQAAELKSTRRLTADAGSFALTGQDATFAVALSAAQGAFALAGQSVILARGNGLVATGGSFALSGKSVTLRHEYTLVAAGGTFALAGKDAHRQLGNWTPQAYVLAAGVGEFFLRGYNVVTPARFAQGRAVPPNRRRVKPKAYEFIPTDGALIFSGSARVYVEAVSLRHIYGGRGNLGLQACAGVEVEALRVDYFYQVEMDSGVQIPGGSAVSSYTPGLRAYSARAGPISRTLSRWSGSAVCELQTRQRRSA